MPHYGKTVISIYYGKALIQCPEPHLRGMGFAKIVIPGLFILLFVHLSFGTGVSLSTSTQQSGANHLDVSSASYWAKIDPPDNVSVSYPYFADIIDPPQVYANWSSGGEVMLYFSPFAERGNHIGPVGACTGFFTLQLVRLCVEFLHYHYTYPNCNDLTLAPVSGIVCNDLSAESIPDGAPLYIFNKRIYQDPINGSDSLGYMQVFKITNNNSKNVSFIAAAGKLFDDVEKGSIELFSGNYSPYVWPSSIYWPPNSSSSFDIFSFHPLAGGGYFFSTTRQLPVIFDEEGKTWAANFSANLSANTSIFLFLRYKETARIKIKADNIALFPPSLSIANEQVNITFTLNIAFNSSTRLYDNVELPGIIDYRYWAETDNAEDDDFLWLFPYYYHYDKDRPRPIISILKSRRFIESIHAPSNYSYVYGNGVVQANATVMGPFLGPAQEIIPLQRMTLEEINSSLYGHSGVLSSDGSQEREWRIESAKQASALPSGDGMKNIRAGEFVPSENNFPSASAGQAGENIQARGQVQSKESIPLGKRLASGEHAQTIDARLREDAQILGTPLREETEAAQGVPAEDYLTSAKRSTGRFFIRPPENRFGAEKKPLSIGSLERKIRGLNATVRNRFKGLLSAALGESEVKKLSREGYQLEEVKYLQLLGKVQTPFGPVEQDIAKIGAPSVWNVSGKGKGVVVAVLDTGIAMENGTLSHPDLQNTSDRTIWPVGIADGPMDQVWHGTHVIGTIAANGDYNGDGVIDEGEGFFGVAPKSSILSIAVCSPVGCAEDDILAGIDRAIVGYDNISGTGDEADIISMSIGSPERTSEALYAGIKEAYSRGIVLVAAAGNDYVRGNDPTIFVNKMSRINYPAAYPEVISVGAVDENDTISFFSSRGNRWDAYCHENSARHRCIDVVSYGVNVNSTVPSYAEFAQGQGYMAASGTSMAAPHVAGAIALLLAKYPGMTNEQVRLSLAKNTLKKRIYNENNYYNWTFSSSVDRLLNRTLSWKVKGSSLSPGTPVLVSSPLTVINNDKNLGLNGLKFGSSLSALWGLPGWNCTVANGTISVKAGSSNSTPEDVVNCTGNGLEMREIESASADEWKKLVIIQQNTKGINFSNITVTTETKSFALPGKDLSLLVQWGGQWLNITPPKEGRCNETQPEYSKFKVINDTFYSCMESTGGAGRPNFFRWVQPRIENADTFFMLTSGPPGNNFEFQGINYVSWWYNEYESWSSNMSLDLISKTDANFVSILVPWYQNGTSEAVIYQDLTKTPTDRGVQAAIGKARSLGLKVALNPLLDLWDNNGWRGEIAFSTEAGWKNWFSNYTAFIIKYAQMAQDGGVDLFYIGTELVKTSGRISDWRKIINDVREIYSGEIVYASHFGDEDRAISWWDGLDYIGINAYYNLTNKYDPSISELKKGWGSYIPFIENLSSSFNKSVIFTEIGYQNRNGTARAPWWVSGELDNQEQEDAYEAAFEAFWNRTWFKGMFWWDRDTYPYTDYRYDNGFRTLGKPAERVMKKWYLPVKPIQALPYLTFNRSLHKGWNLVSFPLGLGDKAMPSSLLPTGGNGTKIFSYSRGNWSILIGNSTLNETKGYWVYMLSDGALEIEGTYPLHPVWSFRKGLNLASYPSLQPALINETFDAMFPSGYANQSNYSAVFFYNNSQWYSYFAGRNASLNTLAFFTPGYGYWVRVG